MEIEAGRQVSQGISSMLSSDQSLGQAGDNWGSVAGVTQLVPWDQMTQQGSTEITMGLCQSLDISIQLPTRM